MRFRRFSKNALGKRDADRVIATIKRKYRSKKHSMGYKGLNATVNREYRNAGYKGNLYNDSGYVRDNVSSFLLQPRLKEKRSTHRRLRRSHRRRRSNYKFGLSDGVLTNLLS